MCLIGQLSAAQKPTMLKSFYRPSISFGTIKDFLDDINHQSHFIIEYSISSLDSSSRVFLAGDPISLGKVLQQVLAGQKVSLVEKNNKIILVPSQYPISPEAFISYYSVYGIIKETIGYEPLADANIWEADMQTGTLSNTNGYFTLLLPEGKHRVWFSYAGYYYKKLDIDLNNNEQVDIQLIPKSEITEFTVTTPLVKEKITWAEKVKSEGNPNNIFLGEYDPLRSLYQLPGIKSIPEFTNGLMVRGGSPDQNLFLLDGTPILNPTHLLGTVSIINKTMLKSLHFYKGNFPARFSGALSSIIDVASKDGNMKEWKGEVNTSLLAGSFTLEGPLKKEKSALMIGFRHSWVNPFLRLFNTGLGINFYDLHLKYTQLIGKSDKLMLNYYSGNDKLLIHQNNTNNLQSWGNQALSLSWNHLIAPKAFLNTSINASSYHNNAGFRYSLYDSAGNNIKDRVYNTFSSNNQYNLATQLEFFATNNVKFNIGARFSYTLIKPFDTNISSDFVANSNDFIAIPPLSFKEISLYYENEIKVDKKFLFRPGLAVSHYLNNGFQYTSWQPRLYVIYKVNVRQQFDFSFGHMTQYLHQVTNPYLGINSEAWVPSTEILVPEESNMVSGGYTYQNDKKFALSTEVYFKELKHVTNYAEGKNLFLNNSSWEDNLLLGKGWTYGLEVKAGKTLGKWQLNLAYTLSWNWRQFADVNGGAKFPFKYDRRHEINLVSSYSFKSHWEISALWMFTTGDIFTLPDKIYPDFDVAQQISDPLEPKEYRLIYHSSAAIMHRTLPYHRLDISAAYKHHYRKSINTLLTLGVYNLYGSPSQYVYDLEGTLGKRSLVVTTRNNFFSITPYLSYNFSF